MGEVNVVAEMRALSTTNPDLESYPSSSSITCGTLNGWADRMERLEAERAVAGKVIFDLLFWVNSCKTSKWGGGGYRTLAGVAVPKLISRAEEYLNSQTGDTL